MIVVALPNWFAFIGVRAPVTTPFKWVFSEKPEADGREACDYAWQVEEPPEEAADASEDSAQRRGPPTFP